MEEEKEIKNRVESCNLCGLCKSVCPVYEVLINERYSPRGKAILLKHGEEDRTFYACTLCGNCIMRCPAKVNLRLREHREKLAETLTTKANKAMITSIRKYGDPCGEDSEKEN
jgi:Fe-S oxidoreductase